LARALRDEQGFGVFFSASAGIAAMIREAGFGADADAPPLAVAGQRKFDLAIVDVKDRLTRDDVAALAAKIGVVAAIDDGSDRRLAATHAYYPPVPQARELSWAGSACKAHIGWEWCILGFEPSRLERQPASERIMVSMGGADPLGLTDLMLEALRRLPEPAQADIVIGPAFAKREALISRIGDMGPNFHAQTGTGNLASLFANSVLALIAFGVTAYELAALGVPALYVPISQDHVRSASAFADAGMGQALPLGVTADQIAQTVAALLKDEPRRRVMVAAGPQYIDGKGAGRIAADLAAAVTA
jgi:spore coat polysaccharide biosynthesis protein SpsF